MGGGGAPVTKVGWLGFRCYTLAYLQVVNEKLTWINQSRYYQSCHDKNCDQRAVPGDWGYLRQFKG